MNNQNNKDNERVAQRGRDDELLTIGEVADIVRVPVATLRYWRHLGTGPAASASAAACATGTTKSPPGCKAKATDPPPHESWSSQWLAGT